MFVFNSPLFLPVVFLRIPVIGGKELDLHILYVEVTKRGGYEKVRLCLIPSMSKTQYIHSLLSTLGFSAERGNKRVGCCREEMEGSG